MTPKPSGIDEASMSSRRDRYTILGIELNVDGPTTAAVYAFDRLEHSIARLEEIVELGLSRGEIPVVRFDIPEMDAGDFIRHAFRRISVRLVIQDLHDQVFVVNESNSAQADESRGTERLEHSSRQTRMCRH